MMCTVKPLLGTERFEQLSLDHVASAVEYSSKARPRPGKSGSGASLKSLRRQLHAYARLSGGAATALGPTRQHPIRPGKMTGIAPGVALEIILMFGLSLPELARR